MLDHDLERYQQDYQNALYVLQSGGRITHGNSYGEYTLYSPWGTLQIVTEEAFRGSLYRIVKPDGEGGWIYNDNVPLGYDIVLYGFIKASDPTFALLETPQHMSHRIIGVVFSCQFFITNPSRFVGPRHAGTRLSAFGMAAYAFERETNEHWPDLVEATIYTTKDAATRAMNNQMEALYSDPKNVEVRVSHLKRKRGV